MKRVHALSGSGFYKRLRAGFGGPVNASSGQRGAGVAPPTAPPPRWVTADEHNSVRAVREPADMKDNSLPRIVVIILCTVVFIAVLVVNALAGAGKGELDTVTQM